MSRNNSAIEEANQDNPPHSRVFITFPKKDPLDENELRDDFEQFGEIQYIRILKNRSSDEPTGIAYIKYSKMSEAALAIENKHNQSITNHSGYYKVHMAKSRTEVNKTGADEDPQKLYTVFIRFDPDICTKDDVKEYFQNFGNITRFTLLKDLKNKGALRGLGYIVYSKISEAAMALENTRKENGILGADMLRTKQTEQATPVPTTFSRPSLLGHPSAANGVRGGWPAKDYGASDPAYNYDNRPEAASSFPLLVTASNALQIDQVERLFDVVPNFVSGQFYRSASQVGRVSYIVTYSTRNSAQHALEKLNGFEYPLGEFIGVEVYYKPAPLQMYPNNDSLHSSLNASNVNEKIASLTQALTEARELLQAVGQGGQASMVGNFKNDARAPYCDFRLPPTQPMIRKTPEMTSIPGLRLFFLCQPTAPAKNILEDLFCRFGNFAGISMNPKKTFGYALFGDADSAHAAMAAINGKKIAGSFLKILEAEQKEDDSTGSESSKRRRLDLGDDF